jgi:hypothetical protein
VTAKLFQPHLGCRNGGASPKSSGLSVEEQLQLRAVSAV